MPQELLVKNVRKNGETVDILVADGRIKAIQQGASPSSDVKVIDGGGRLIFPGLVDAHAHLDKNLLGLPWYEHPVGLGLVEKIADERNARIRLGIDFREQAARQLRMAIAFGTTHIRSCVDIDTDGKLAGFEGVMRAKEDFKGSIDIQTVAFPQSGMLIRPGTVDLMEEALKNGADCVGGIDPSLIDRDPVEHVNVIFNLAEKYDKDIDFHLHEAGALGAFSIELIADRTKAIGWQGRVAIGHALCLGDVDEAYLKRLIDLLLENRIVIASNGPGGYRNSPPVKRLKEAGVVVCCGVDGVRDTWAPMNMPDMLMRTYIVAYRNGMVADSELEMALDISTYGGAAGIRLENYGLDTGCNADFFLVDGEVAAQAVIDRPPRWLVVKNGSVVAREGECMV
jgi:cytosine/adenosine deaminase-related metal-dependent hydrolase